jgi:hypothetical protein
MYVCGLRRLRSRSSAITPSDMGAANRIFRLAKGQSDLGVAKALTTHRVDLLGRVEGVHVNNDAPPARPYAIAYGAQATKLTIPRMMDTTIPMAEMLAAT